MWVSLWRAWDGASSSSIACNPIVNFLENYRMREDHCQSDLPLPSSGARKVMVISRCAWTLFNFRLSLIDALAAQGCEVIALGSAGDGFDSKLLSHGVDFRPVRL